MKSLYFLVVIWAFALTNPVSAFAQSLAIQGVASYQKNSKKITALETERLKSLALNDALTRYSGNFSLTQQQLFTQKQTQIRSSIYSYFSSVTVLDLSYDKKTNTHQMVVRGLLNSAKLNGALNAVSERQLSVSSETTLMTVLFIARETSQKQIYDQDRTTISENESARENSQSVEGGQNNQISSRSTVFSETNNETSQDKSIYVSRTGGSTFIKEDRPIYVKSTSEKISSSMSQILADNHFDIAEFKQLIAEPECQIPSEQVINDEFSQADELSAVVFSKVIKGARRCELDAIVIGTMDAGGTTTDPVTGNKRVNVSVRLKVYTLKSRFAKTVASIGPVQFSGLGRDRNEAINNAVNLASQSAAKTIVSSLRAKGY